jgi:hypothetical protein
VNVVGDATDLVKGSALTLNDAADRPVELGAPWRLDDRLSVFGPEDDVVDEMSLSGRRRVARPGRRDAVSLEQQLALGLKRRKAVMPFLVSDVAADLELGISVVRES